MSEYLDFLPPAELRTRGTVLVVAGRGESAATYQRFGQRIAADSYRVRVLPAPTLAADDLDGSLHEFGSTVAAAVAAIATDGPVRPLVLVGSDVGAVALAALVARSGPGAGWWPDAVILAALPGHGARYTGDWDAELEVRTHCTVHRGVLGDDPAVAPGSLATAVPDAWLDAAYVGGVDLPHLLLSGAQDPVADPDGLARLVKSLPSARSVVVRGAHHDVLNDLQHRSVAATVVTFLETLRNDPPLTPIIETASGTW